VPKHLALAALAVASTLLGCGRSHPAAPPEARPPAGVGSAPTGATAYVSAVTVLRREPSEAARVRGPGGKEIGNPLVTLQRGEQVALLEPREEWARIRASDDLEGWIKRTALLEGDGVVEATVLGPADVFDRPDLLAANARRKIDPATLVLVVRSRPPFSEVNLAGGQTAWVLSERLSSGEKEVSVAKLAEKARWLVRSGKKDEALAVLALAREHFAGVALVDALATELGEAPAAPPPGAAAPGSPVIPAGAPAPSPKE
jgi:hypothetical protein